MIDLLLLGGGGHCKSCIDVIELEGKYKIKGILDIKEKIGQVVLGFPIIGTDLELVKYSKYIKTFFITIGHIKSVENRVRVYNHLIELGCKLPVIISPNAYVSKHSKICQGTIIMHYAQVNAGSHIGNNCIINSKALIEHDAIVGDHCHISTGAIVNGGTNVGARSFIGSGAVSIQYINIPEGSFIKANSIVK